MAKQGFGWQPWGSLASLGGAAYGYSAGHPHAVDLVNGVDRYDYDANGSMVVRSKGVSGQEQALQWDANNRLAQVVSSSGVTETYRYDEHGQRIRKQVAYSSTVGDTVTYVPFVFYEQAVSAGGSVVTRHYSVNGERVAVRVGGALSYLYHDQVGSTILATDAITNVVSSRGYYAFGATRRSSGVTPTDRRFTGQVEDPTGLYYYNSRYYDPQLGQFLSPDTIVPEPTNLLSYNRYLYAKGNPLKYSDPTGHYSVEELQQHFGVNSFDELMALFGEGGQYEGNSGWYDILRAAQDGDQITAVLPDAVTSISGNFTRDADGRIQIDMGGGQIVAENVFAEFGGHRTGMTYNGHPAEYGAYYLQGASGARWATAVSGTQAIADVPCNTWDCVAIGYDIAAIGGNALYSVSLAGVLPSGGLSTAGVYSGILISHAASAAGLYRTYKGLATGSTSTVDLAIANVTTWVSPMPGLGAHMQGIQLAWDLIDPFVPD